MNPVLRWLIGRDMPEVLGIEARAFPNAWTRDDFSACLKQRNCIGLVAEVNHQVTGYVVYEIHKSELHILNLAVDPEWHRHGIGTAMLQRVKDKLSQQRRSRLLLTVRETNLAAQKFFRRQGMYATEIVCGHFDDSDEDGYVMEYRVGEAADWFRWSPRNRIAEYV